MTQLRQGSTLQGGKYIIKRVLGQGGFGITYEGLQVGLNRKVVIKEFFLREYCERDGQTSHVTSGTTTIREIVEKFREKCERTGNRSLWEQTASSDVWKVRQQYNSY